MTPAGGDGLRIREVVDIDFGSDERRGYQRLIPNDFGVPVDVDGLSPDAPDDVSVVPEGDETRIRVGDPAVTNTGQHRYVLTYTLPDARLSTGELALDIIGNDETLATEHVRDRRRRPRPRRPAVQRRLVRAVRRVRPRGADGTYRAEIEHARARGTASRSAGASRAITTPPAVAEPPLPARISDNRVPLAVADGAARAGVWRSRLPLGRVAAAATRSSPAVPPTPPTARHPLSPGVTSSRRRSHRRPLGSRPGAPRRRRASWPTWQRPSSSHRRASSRGRAPCCCASGSTTRPSARGSPGWPPATSSPSSATATTRRSCAPGRSSKALAPTSPRSCRTCSPTVTRSRSAATTRTSPRRGRACAPIRSGRSPPPGFWKRAASAGDADAVLAGPSSWCSFIWVIIGAGSLLTAVLGWFSSPLGAIVFGIVVPASSALRRLPDAPAGPLGDRLGTGPAHRVVPSLPRRQRGPPRRVGVDAGPAARVLGVGGGPRRGNGLGAGAGGLERPARRVRRPGRCSSTAWDRRSPARTPHRRARAGPAGVLRRRVLRRQRRWRRRRRQLRQLVKTFRFAT